MVSNMFLKFSELAVGDNSPFSNNCSATTEAVLTEFLSLEEIHAIPLEDLVDYICKKSRNRFANPNQTAEILQKAAKDSYRLDKCLYEPLTISIASSFNCISVFEKEIKVIDKAIERVIQGINTSEGEPVRQFQG